MKDVTINAATGEIEEIELTADEVAEREALIMALRTEAHQLKARTLSVENEKVLLNTLLQVFVGYLGLHMQGNLPVVTFADFMGQVFEGYIQNGGKIDP
jgi:hypothetical protein